MPVDEKASMTKEDLTGRDRLVSNVLFNWGGHFVFIVAGFILPRMIDRRLGQDLLGVWDFAWSLVNYFELVSAGVSSSVGRYVARCRVTRDSEGVSTVVSSACCILAVSGLLALALTLGSSLLLPRFFGDRLGENVSEAQWVVLLLGTSIAVEIALQPFNGVLTGCHRWGLQNAIKTGWHAVTIGAMIVALLKGGSLRTLALVFVIGIILAYGTRMLFAYRICEGLRVRPSLIQWRIIKEHLVFGAKTLVPKLSHLLMNQTAGILIVAYLGPAMLALYSRPRALTMTMHALVHKMSMILTPTISSLHSGGDLQEIRQVAIKSVRYSTYMALPMVLSLSILGGPILRLWMGAHYANDWLPAILAVGYFAMTTQQPAWNILMGLNAHGRPGLIMLMASLCSIGLTALALSWLKVGLTGVAFAMVLPLIAMSVFYLPFALCRRIGLDVRTYFLSIVSGPVLHMLPFALCLVTVRVVFHAHPHAILAAGGLLGGIVLAVIYWRYALPSRMKAWCADALKLQPSVR